MTSKVEAKEALAKKAAVAKPASDSEASGAEEKEVEKVDLVAEALKEYRIIQENPWSKGEM